MWPSHLYDKGPYTSKSQSIYWYKLRNYTCSSYTYCDYDILIGKIYLYNDLKGLVFWNLLEYLSNSLALQALGYRALWSYILYEIVCWQT